MVHTPGLGGTSLFLVMLLALPLMAHEGHGEPRQLWAKTYGGDGRFDVPHSVEPLRDGGFLVVGQTSFFGPADAWILRLDPAGNIEWEQKFGGNGSDILTSARQTVDGGFIVVGTTNSYIVGHELTNMWVLRLDRSGLVLWQRTYGFAVGETHGTSVDDTSDGGFVLAGDMTSFGTEGGGTGHADFWVVKLDGGGNVDWQRNYGGTLDEIAYSIEQTSDRGFVVAGCTVCFFDPHKDSWVLRLDSEGNILWQKSYGGAGGDVAHAVLQTSDGGFFLAGETGSFGAGRSDLWALRLDASGNIAWEQAYGGSDNDLAWSAKQTRDGGLIVAGRLGLDAWLIKLDARGGVSWQKTYGGTETGTVQLRSVGLTLDNGYVAAGEARSSGPGFFDASVLRIDARGTIPKCDPGAESAAIATRTSAVPAVPRSGASLLRPLVVAATDAEAETSSPSVEVQCALGAHG